jgi:hypothetical protein
MDDRLGNVADAAHDDDVGGCCSFFKRRNKKSSPRPSAPQNVMPALCPDRLNDKANNRQTISPNETGGVGHIEQEITPEAHFPPVTVAVGTSAESPGNKATEEKPPEDSRNTKFRSSQRIRAEAKVKEASEKLEKAMSNHGVKTEIPQGLLQLDITADVHGRAKKIESEIDELMKAREELKASPSRLRAVKKSVKYWFNAVFPVVNSAVKVVGVRIHIRLPSSSTNGFQGLIPSPYSTPVTALVFILQVVTP